MGPAPTGQIRLLNDLEKAALRSAVEKWERAEVPPSPAGGRPENREEAAKRILSCLDEQNAKDPPSLFLNDMGLSDLPPGLDGLHLKGLLLVGNRLTSLPLGEKTGGFPGLKELNLGRNPLPLKAFSRLGELTSLHNLALSGIPLGRLPVSINKLSQLKELWANGCELTEANVDALIELRTLGLAHNSLRVAPDLNHLKELRKIILYKNELLIPPDFTASRNMVEINLGANQLAAVPDVRDMEGLRALILHENQVTALPEWFYTDRRPMNAGIDLTGNALNAETIARLQGITTERPIYYGMEALRSAVEKWERAEVPPSPAGGRPENREGAAKEILRCLDRQNVGDPPSLSLHGMGLSDLPSGLERLRLSLLDLGDNRLINFPLGKEEGGFPGLKSLNLDGNPLPLEAFSRLGELTSLDALFLNRIPLERLPDSLNALTQLTTLHVQGCRLTEVNVGTLTQLEELHVAGNRITIAPELGTRPALKRLYLSDNQLAIPPDITGCPNLCVVRLDNNRLVAMPDIRKPPEDIYISVAGNQLTTLPDWLFDVRLSERACLNVERNPLDAATLERLQTRQTKGGGRIDFAMEVSRPAPTGWISPLNDEEKEALRCTVMEWAKAELPPLQAGRSPENREKAAGEILSYLDPKNDHYPERILYLVS